MIILNDFSFPTEAIMTEVTTITKFQLILRRPFLETTRVIGYRSRTKGEYH